MSTPAKKAATAQTTQETPVNENVDQKGVIPGGKETTTPADKTPDSEPSTPEDNVKEPSQSGDYATEKALNQQTISEPAPEEPAVSDVETVGKPDAWVTLNSVSSKAQGFVKTTRAMAVGSGVLVSVSSEFRNQHSGQITTCAEALEFVPGMTIAVTPEGTHLAAAGIY